MNGYDPYAPAPSPTYYYGYQNGQTYMINGYRMYLHSGFWYYVDFPYLAPLQASCQQYRTGGTPGAFFKFIGVIALIAGIGLMFGDGIAFIFPGALLLTLGIFGTALAIVDSTRNHPAEWKAAATIAVAAYVVHSLTDDDH